MVFVNSGISLLVAIVFMTSVSSFHSLAYASECDLHNSPIAALADPAFLAERVIVGPNADLSEHERQAFEATVRIRHASGILLSDCKTILTGAHVSQSKVDGSLLDEARIAYHEGKGSDRSEIVRIFGSGVGESWSTSREGREYVSYKDWNVLQLKEKKKGCKGVEPAYVSKERLRKLAEEGKVFSVGVSPPVGNGFARSGDDIVDYNKILIRNTQVIDGKKMYKVPAPEDFKDMLWDTSFGKVNDSDHARFAIIENKIYAVATYIAPANDYCVDQSPENRAYGCPAESLWITDENPYGKAIIKAMSQSNDWTMKRFL